MTETAKVGERIRLGALMARVRSDVAPRLRRLVSDVGSRLAWRSEPVLPPYTLHRKSLSHRAILTMQMVGLALFCVVYGATVGLFGMSVVGILLVPQVVLFGLVVWALPEARTAPVAALGALFFMTTIVLAGWPYYVAFDLPGLPWITFSRFVDGPLVAILLYCLSTSRDFRQQVARVLGADLTVVKLLGAFVAIQFITLPFSHSLGSSVSKIISDQVEMTATFFVAAYIFTRKGAVTKWIIALWCLALYEGVLSVIEAHLHHAFWAGHIPSFLTVSDPNMSKLGQGAFRSGRYRASGTFDGPIQLGEFAVLCFTFVLHVAVSHPNRFLRALAGISAPLILVVTIGTGSRSGAVGFLEATSLYGLYWGIRQWRLRPQSLFAPLFVLSYPLIAAAVFLSTFFIGFLRIKIWGGGADASSNMGRATEMALAIPKVLKHPWGYGIGNSASILGFAPAGVLTVDNYYITLALDYGVLGLLAFVALFLYTSGRSAYSSIMTYSKDWEVTCLAPAAIALANFLVIKAVFSQPDNHFFFFSVLGMSVALLGRARSDAVAGPNTSPVWRGRRRRSPPGASPAPATPGPR